MRRATRTALLVANPVARAVTATRIDAVAAVLGQAYAVERVQTKARGHALELAAAAVQDGLDLVAVLGGDGTLNEAANALAGTETAVAVLPGGQANVFARSLGLPRDPVAAANIAVARAREPRRVPLGRVDGRWFTSNCGVGFDAAVVREVEAHPESKRRLGDWFFLLTAAKVFTRGFDRRTPRLSVAWGSQPDERAEDVFLAIVQNLSPYTYFGRRAMRVTPNAGLEGGLDALWLDSMRLRVVLAVALSSFARAGHVAHRHVGGAHDVPWLQIGSLRPMPVQADGEYLGQHTNVRIESVPAALLVAG